MNTLYHYNPVSGGRIGDRIEPRTVLTRIVLWYPVFTSCTGLAWSYVELLPLRFLFGGARRARAAVWHIPGRVRHEWAPALGPTQELIPAELETAEEERVG